MPEAPRKPAAPAEAYPDHIPGRFTGGFGEETCHSCHFDYDLNDERGSLEVSGIGDTYQPGSNYNVTITVESERLGKGGFQMTARFEDGTQAGSFAWSGDRLTLTPLEDNPIEYLQHSAAGTAPVEERTARWSFVWQAPKNDTRPVTFNIAANAGNDDLSSFGDWIYVREWVAGSK